MACNLTRSLLEGMSFEPFDLRGAMVMCLENCSVYQFYAIRNTVNTIEKRLNGKATEISRTGEKDSYNRRGEYTQNDTTGFRYRIGIEYYDKKGALSDPRKTKYYLFNIRTNQHD